MTSEDMKLSLSEDVENNSSIDLDMMKYSPKEMVEFSREMSRFCIKQKGIGLSACQIGRYERFFVYRPDKKEFFLVINPRYFAVASRYQVEEGCLSYGPDNYYTVKRYRQIQVEYWTVEEDQYVFHKGKMKGEWAEIFQHETDHCNGITIAKKGKRVA